MEKKYWQSIDQTKADYQPPKEEKDASMVDILSNQGNDKAASRRDFLKWCGISFFSATVISACENPVKKAIPYLHQPETLTPGKAHYYASTYAEGNNYCSILVKSRDGRPIKIEGNALSAFGGGGTSAQVQASVLSLYDDGARYKHPVKNGEKVSWAKADAHIKKVLRQASEKNQKCYLVTPTLLSPSLKALLKQLKAKYSALQVVTWDAISTEAIRQAHQTSFGNAVIPDYRFEKAELIVSFGADFLGSWIAPVVFAQRYAQTRKLDPSNPAMSRHVHFEAGMSLTGSNADERVAVKPSQELEILMGLYNEMALLSGYPVISSPATDYDTKTLAKDILSHKGKALVVCGHNNPEAQVLVNAINEMAGSYGHTLDVSQPLMAGQADHHQMERLLQDLEQEQVAAVMFYKTNPLYNHPNASAFASLLSRAALTVSFACAKDETSRACEYVLPDNHYLESWGDAQPKTGHYSLMQPVMQPIFNTRQFQAGLLGWLEKENDYHQYLKAYWQQNLFVRQNRYPDFPTFWVNTLQEGVFHTDENAAFNADFRQGVLSENIEKLKSQTSQATEVQLCLYENVAMADGVHANNPWLQELPDPVTKVTWDNFAAISQRFATDHHLKEGDMIRIRDLRLPVLIQPGQAYGTFSVALGYGRTHAGKCGNHIGVNVFELYKPGTFNLDSWSKEGSGYEFARTQTHHSMEGRDIVRESTLEQYRKNPKAGNEIRDYHLKHMTTLYPEQEFQGHHWALMVDLNACTGCSTCVVACQAENNTPVIGREEVRRRRIMHWVRIDRYYTGDVENPGVVYQPLMCQHCDHAPCENVCPVAATTHSAEGINQITYNRCVGTKYCINNCPYKVRRFNWFEYARNDKFDYHMNSDLGRMVLNPDVTVRERGVVEKCSFCIQRIQEAKLKAKIERRKLKDGEVIPACMGACPSNALVFGDLNDKDSKVSQLIQQPRNYHLLEELHVLPSVGYLTKIRNPKKV